MKFYDLSELKTTIEIIRKNKYEPAGECVSLIDDGENYGVYVHSKKPLKFIKLSWYVPYCTDDALVLGDEFERGYGKFEWKKADASRKLFWYFLVSDKKDSCAYGVKTGCSSFAIWRAEGNTISLELDVRNGTRPVLLGDRILHACDIVSAKSNDGENVHDFYRRFCAIMCPAPRLPKTPVYGTNTWYYAFTTTNAELVKMDADLLAECTTGLENRPYMVVDDGWESINMNLYAAKREPLWLPNKKKFPDMKGIADYIREKDERPGIWIRLLIGSRLTPRSWRTRPRLPGHLITLDPSRPEVLFHVEEMIKRVRGWGFELIKHDFSTHDLFLTYGSDYSKPLCPRHFHDRTKTTAEIALDFYKAIRRAAGDDCVIIGCNTISHLSAGLFELERIGDDTSPEKWHRVVTMGVNCLAFRAAQHNTFYACDADCIGYMAKIPWEKNRQWLDLLARSGTPLFTSIDPRLVTDEIKSDLKAAYALSEKQTIVSLPVDWFDTRYPEVWQDNEGNVYKYDFRF